MAREKLVASLKTDTERMFPLFVEGAQILGGLDSSAGYVDGVYTGKDMCGYASAVLGLLLKLEGRIGIKSAITYPDKWRVDLEYGHWFLCEKSERQAIVIDPTYKQFLYDVSAAARLPNVFVGTREELLSVIGRPKKYGWKTGNPQEVTVNSLMEGLLQGFYGNVVLDNSGKYQKKGLVDFLKSRGVVAEERKESRELLSTPAR